MLQPELQKQSEIVNRLQAELIEHLDDNSSSRSVADISQAVTSAVAALEILVRIDQQLPPTDGSFYFEIQGQKTDKGNDDAATALD